MTKYENECCDCATESYPCMGSACPNRNVKHLYCDKCKDHYLLDGDESRCRVISLGMSSAKCVQVKECHKFNEKMEK